MGRLEGRSTVVTGAASGIGRATSLLFAKEGAAVVCVDRAGEVAEVLVDEVLGDGRYLGRGAHQAPEVDGATEICSKRTLIPGDFVPALVTGSDGVDLQAEAEPALQGAATAPRDRGPVAP